MQLEYKEELKPTTLQDVLPLLKQVKKSGKGYTALCPVHNDKHNSFSVSEGDDGKLLMHCHACKAEFEEILKVLGLFDTKKEGKFTIVAEYDYVDEEGEVVFQVVRLHPKSFRQRRLNRNGEWIYNLDGIVRVLYNLPEVIEAQTVYVVEGEKDANVLIKAGYVATTNAGGAGKWLKEYNKYFKGKDVVIIPDNDDAGRLHANLVASNVYEIANSVKVVTLPDLKEKQDVSDWIKKNGVDALGRLVDTISPAVLSAEDLEFEEELPVSVESENFILGVVLSDPNFTVKLIESNVYKDFYNPTNKKILRAIIECFENKEHINVVTVSERLKLNGQYELVGGIDHLNKLKSSAPDSVGLESWLRVVRQKAELRALINVAKKAKKIASRETDSPENLSTEIIAEINALKRDRHKTPFVKVDDKVDEVIRAVRDNVNGTSGTSTGFVDFDALTSGLQKTDFLILAGRPKSGKSVFGMNVAYNVAKSGKNVLVFSMEMSKEQLIQRILASESKVSLTSIRNGDLSKDDWTRLAMARQSMREASLFIDETPGQSINEVRAKLLQFVDQYGDLDLIVIDYLQLMSGSKKENRQQEISEISRELKKIAKEFNVPVIALSQLSRATELRADRRPLLSDLRESGCLSGDTEIYLPLEGKYVPIKELEGKKGFQVATFNNDTNAYEIGTCTNSFSTGFKKVFLLETYHGKEIKLTSNHKILGERGWMPLSDFKVGDRINVPKNLEFDTGLENVENDVAAFLGLMIGDGCVLERRTPSFCNNDRDLLDKSKSLAYSIWNDKVSISESNYGFTWSTVSFSGVEKVAPGRGSVVTDLFKSYGLHGKRSHEKFIPKELLASKNSTIREFIRHLWSTDGTIYIKDRKSRGNGVLKQRNIEPHVYISYSTNSPQLAKDLNKLLLRLGVYSKISKTTKGSYRPNYNITVVGKKSQYKFCKEIGIFGKRKSSVVKKALEILDKNKGNEDFRWDRIKSIKELGVEKVYDLTVPSNSNFVANSLLVHNSLEQDTDLVMFIYRDEYYNKTVDNEGMAELIVAKHRNGEEATIDLAFVGKYATFINTFTEKVEISS